MTTTHVQRPLRAVLYLRISSDKEGRELGVRRQEQHCRELAARKGWTIVKIYRDNDRSASLFARRERPEYKQMLEDARDGQFDVIVAYTSSRLTREPSVEVLIGLAVEHGIDFEYVNSPSFNLRTAAGRTAARKQAADDAGESDVISERVMDKLKANAMEGKPHGGFRPYGWEKDRVTICEGEAAVIREAHRRVLAGESLRGIYLDLNARGVPNASGNPWTHATFRNVIMSARHAGIRTYHGEIVKRDAYPEIVSETQWKAVVRVLSDPARVTTPGRGGKVHLLSALARVTPCGEPVYVGQSRGGVPSYRCKGWHVSRHQARVDEFVSAVIVERFRLMNAREWAALAAPRGVTPDLAAADERARNIRQRLDEAAEMFAAEDITRAQLLTLTKSLRAQLEEAERAATPPADPGPELGGLIVPGREAETWEALSVERKRMIIGGLFTVTLRPGVRGHGWNPAGIEIESR